MQSSSTRCICNYSHHLKQPMICCDKCAKWQHANCMGITPTEFAEFNKCKDLAYHCEKCEPRHIDQERARAYQEELLKRSMQHDKTSTDTASTDEDDTARGKSLADERKTSRDERKAAELQKIFEKMNHEKKGGRRRTAAKKEEKEEEEPEDEQSEEEEKERTKKGARRGRPKGSGNKRRQLDDDHQDTKRPRSRKQRELRQTDSPGPADGGNGAEAGSSTPTTTTDRTTSSRATRALGRKRPGRRPGKTRKENNQTPLEPIPPLDEGGSDTEDSADSGLVEECEVVNLTVPLRNPYVRRRLDISKFEHVKSFGHEVTITFHDWEWRGGNNSKVIKKESDTWTSSLGKNGSGHFKKQWLMKNTEETKEVPDVNEIIREELRKRNVDLTKIPELNENGVEPTIANLPPSDATPTPRDDHSSDQSSQKSDASQPRDQIWNPMDPTPASNTSSTSPSDSNSGTPKSDEKPQKKLSMAEYLARNRERKKREAEEKAKLEAERQKQQESRLSNDAVTAVLSSAIGAATNGSRVCEINADDIAWLSHLVGINLNNNQPAAELPIETTAERLSRLYHTSEQVLNTMRAANVLAALTAQQNK